MTPRYESQCQSEFRAREQEADRAEFERGPAGVTAKAAAVAADFERIHHQEAHFLRTIAVLLAIWCPVIMLNEPWNELLLDEVGWVLTVCSLR